jgi:hypothetical protein
MATKNQTRGTAGIFLCLFTALVFCSVVTAWQQRIMHGSPGLHENVTALGDHSWYKIKSDNDLHQPLLIFPQQQRGIYRRSDAPVNKDDSQMKKVAIEKGGRWSIYVPSSGLEDGHEEPPRYYLKSGENEYLEFGARNHWPEFAPQAGEKRRGTDP